MSMDTMTPRVVTTDQDIERCFEVMVELRPLLPREEFVERVRDMEAQGYRLAYIEQQGEVICVAGYRVTSNLWLGKNLYVDDLVTAEAHRSGGHGAHMLRWLRELAIAEDCKALHLDSGSQRRRAHKFYLEHDLEIVGFHFLEELE